MPPPTSRRTLPVVTGTLGDPAFDIGKLNKETGYFTFDPGLHVDGLGAKRDHVHRRRRRRAALSRLSDRAAREAFELPRSRLSPDQRRAADERRVRRVRPRSHASHDDARVAAQLPERLPLRRASDGDAVRLGRVAVGVLSRHARHQRSRAAPPRRDPPDREDADARCGCVPLFDRLADPLSAQQSRIRHPLPAHDVRGAERAAAAIPVAAKALDLLFILHADHEQNAAPRPCAWSARPARILTPASPRASPRCGGPRTAARTRPYSKMLGEIGDAKNVGKAVERPRTRIRASA